MNQPRPIFDLFKNKFYRKCRRRKRDFNSDCLRRRRSCWPLELDHQYHGSSFYSFIPELVLSVRWSYLCSVSSFRFSTNFETILSEKQILTQDSVTLFPDATDGFETLRSMASTRRKRRSVTAKRDRRCRCHRGFLLRNCSIWVEDGISSLQLN